MKKGAIILCGGHSQRMGRDKASLPFGPELMLQRVVRLLSESIDGGKIVVVASPEQRLPALPSDVIIAHDTVRDRGPLEGLLAGLTVLDGQVDAAFATGCDVPLLVPAFVKRMFELLEDFLVALPWDDQFCHPLAAVYRPCVIPVIQRLLAEHQGRLGLISENTRSRRVPMATLRAVDPMLLSLRNLNNPHDYDGVLELLGLNNSATI